MLRPLPPTDDHFVTLGGAGGLTALFVGEEKWRFAIPLRDRTAGRPHDTRHPHPTTPMIGFARISNKSIWGKKGLFGVARIVDFQTSVYVRLH